MIPPNNRKTSKTTQQHQKPFESLISNISTRFINLPAEEIDSCLHQSLQEICKYFQINQGLIFQFSTDQSSAKLTHEWCENGIDSQIHKYQKIPIEKLPFAKQLLSKKRVIYDAGQSKNTLIKQVSQLAVPLNYQEKMIGFVVFESTKSETDRYADTEHLFEILGTIFTKALKQKQNQKIQAGQRKYLEMLATGVVFTDVLQTLIRNIENQWPGMLGLVLLLDEDGQHLHIGASESLPEDYLQSIEGLKVGPNVGSCGTASYLRERVIVEDIVTDPRWDGLRDLAVKYGLKACWSEPVFSSQGNVIGTFAMYYRHRRAPTEEELRTIEMGAHLAGLAIERKRTDEAFRENQRRLSTLISNLPGMAYRCRNDKNWTMEFVSDGSRELTGYRAEQLINNQEISYGELIDPHDRDDIWEQVQTALKDNSSFQTSYRINTPDGQKWVWEQGQGVKDGEGKIIAVEGFITDITERVQAQQNLEHRVEERTHELSTLLEISHDLASTLELETLLNTILDQLRSVVEYDAASIMIRSENILSVRAYRGPIPLDEALQIQFFTHEARANNEVIRQRKPIIVNDIREEQSLALAIREAAGDELESTYSYLRCWMGIPLIVRDIVVGMLTLDHREPNHYTIGQANLALAFANQAAVAIENARLYQETERRANESEALFSVQQAITSQLEMKEVLQMIADEARRLTNTDISAVYLLEGDELEIAYVSGDVPDNIIGYRLALDDSIAGQVIKNREKILVPDTWKNSQVDRIASDQVNARSLLIVPLISGGEPIGTITVANCTPGGFTAEDEQLLTKLAANVVISLENARLYQSESDRRKVAESMREIVAVLNSSQSLGETLNYIVDRANHVMDAQASMIHKINYKDEFVSIEASHGLPASLQSVSGFPLYSNPNADSKILDQKPVWVSDYQKSFQSPETAISTMDEETNRWKTETQKRYRAWLAIPLIVEDSVYGSIAFYFSAPKDFDEDEIKLASAFADQAALAIENNRLYEAAEEAAVVAERNRLARDLHDAVTQTLFSASVIADVLPKIWERNVDEGKRRLEELRQLTRGALSEMRTLLIELRPTALLDTSIEDLIVHLVNSLKARTGIQIDFDQNCMHDPPIEIKEAFYRIAQEAINNIAKHADANHVIIMLNCQKGQAEMIIRDDGLGFDTEISKGEGLGLNIMAERAENVNAKFEMQSAINNGTKLRISWNAQQEGNENE